MSEKVDISLLKEPDWATTYCLLPDIRTLASSLGEFGQMAPVIAQQGTGIIIDGIQRVRLISGNRHLNERFGNAVEVKWVECNDLQAMILHVQMNRARGNVMARKLSKIVKLLEFSAGFKLADYERLFAMTFDELELMLDGSVLKHRKVSSHSYSRAWVPVEAPAGVVESAEIDIERPPNADR